MRSASYVTRARLAPAALAIAPALILAMALRVPLDAWNRAWPAFGFAVLVLGVEAGRDAGKKLEPELWQSWGGPPTTARLRYRDSANVSMTNLRHAHVARVTGIVLPDATQEGRDPRAADEVYETAIGRLISLTRDSKRFPLLFSENVSYGFRRNCLGLRRPAMIIASITFVVAVGAMTYRAASDKAGALPSLLIPSAAAVAAFVWWWQVVNPRWVRRAADSYADRLIEASMLL